jgi:small ligand-binding sensory domain FIST
VAPCLPSLGSMPFAAALSEHPLPTHAVGEVVGEVLDKLGEAPELAVLFVGAAHTGAVEDVVAAVRQLLRPGVLVGCTAGTVVGGDREVEDQAAIALWAGRLPTAQAYRLEAVPTPDGAAIAGFPPRSELPADAAAVLVLADPFTFPVDEFLTGLQDHLGVTLPIVGGMASAARGPGGNRIVLDGDILQDGAVAVVLAGVDVTTVVSQGCRPIGDPMVVTKGEGTLVHELAGRNALERVQAVLQALSPDEVALAQGGLHVGRVVDEHKVDFERGDFIIRNVLGADPRSGAVAVGDMVEVGSTVQLQVRDAVTADEDLLQLMAAREADGALLFTCNGRGTHLFGIEDHDARVVSEALDRAPLAGMSCAGEVGPVGGRSFLHGFTASILLLRDR